MKLDLTLAGAATLATLSLPCQAEPLRIAILESLSGSQTSTGRLYATATQFVIDAANAKGGYNGEKKASRSLPDGRSTTYTSIFPASWNGATRRPAPCRAASSRC